MFDSRRKYGNPFGSFDDYFDSDSNFSCLFPPKRCENLDDFLSKYSKYLDKIENLESKEGNICFTCVNEHNKKCTSCLKGHLLIEFIYSCQSGNLDILKFILKCYPNINISANNNEAFIHALRNGDLNVLKFLLNLYQQRFKTSPRKGGDIVKNVTGNSVKSNIDLSFINESTFIYFCSNGNLKIAKFLLKINKFINISAYNEAGFIEACLNGHLEVAKWLLEINPNISISAEKEIALFNACDHDNLEVAKWLLEINPTIDISLFNKAFIYVFTKKKLEIAKWLFEMNPTIDISSFNQAFYLACSNGFLEGVKWLFEMNPNIDISAEDDRAFIIACENNHFEVAKWFSSICKKYKLIDFYLKELPMNYEISKSLNDVEYKKCSICMEEDISIQTECKHNYCLECISLWYSRNNTICPYCRQTISTTYFLK
jgi:hypothetical protein